MTNDVQNNLKQAVSAFQSDVDEILRIALKWDVEPGVLQELGQFLGVPSLEMAGIFLKKAYLVVGPETLEDATGNGRNISEKGL